MKVRFSVYEVKEVENGMYFRFVNILLERFNDELDALNYVKEQVKCYSILTIQKEYFE